MAHEFGKYRKMREADFEEVSGQKINQAEANPDCPVCAGEGKVEMTVGGDCVKIICRRCFPIQGIIEK
jgi:hypothetical protein